MTGWGRPGQRAPMRIAAIVNPRARRPVEAVREALVGAAPPGSRVDVLLSAAPGDATRLARSVVADVDLIAAVGGDGTVSEVATGIVGSSVPLAIVPAGSTNIVAREVGVPTGLRAAARLIFGPHRIVARDLGRCGDRYFLHMAGAGLDARFFMRTNPDLKRHMGWLAYVPAAASTLRDPPARVRVMADGEVVERLSPFVLVANGAAVVHPAMKLHPAIRSDDGLLDAFVFGPVDALVTARTLVQIGAGQLDAAPEVVAMRARRIEIAAEPSLPVQLDGDVVGATPVRIDVVPGAVRLVAPGSRRETRAKR
jgi:diacylglycerol kinase (ATP)